MNYRRLLSWFALICIIIAFFAFVVSTVITATHFSYPGLCISIMAAAAFGTMFHDYMASEYWRYLKKEK